MPTDIKSPQLAHLDIKKKWDRLHSKADASVAPDACYVLKTCDYLLPAKGRALDLACGLGGNSLFLAEHGFNTTALDISSVAIAAIKDRRHPLIDVVCASADANVLEEAAFDVIVVSNYLDRALCDAITNALKPGGVLFYQTFVQDKANPETGPQNPDYLLAENELLTLFAGLKVLAFSDSGCQGDTEHGFRNQSYLVAQRRLYAGS